MSKKNPILDKLQGGNNFVNLTAPNGLSVSFPMANGRVELSRPVSINGVQLKMGDVLQAVEMIAVGAKGSRCVCVLHGAFEARSMGCSTCNDEMHAKSLLDADHHVFEDAD
jgi:hypothetical protein